MKRTTLLSLLTLSFGLTLGGCMNEGDDQDEKTEKKAEAPAAPTVRSITPAKTITVDTMSDLAGTNALSLADWSAIQNVTAELICVESSDTDPTNPPEPCSNDVARSKLGY